MPLVRVLALRVSAAPGDFSLTPKEAVARQRELAGRVVLRPLPSRIQVVAAADIAVERREKTLFAAVVTFTFPDMAHLETVWAREPARFPYVPGLLSFREAPAVFAAYQKLARPPDVLLCDGQGLAHPRRFGLACHLGLMLGVPAVGCAKSRLCGEHEAFSLRRGNFAPLTLDGEAVGVVLCTRDVVKPVYVSPGHLSDIETSRALVMACAGKYRIPEPLRRAHIEAGRIKAGEGAP